jgi:hypothetical protein
MGNAGSMVARGETMNRWARSLLKKGTGTSRGVVLFGGTGSRLGASPGFQQAAGTAATVLTIL